jgi:hypothetical protein
MAASGCGLIGAASETAVDDAHVVSLVRTDCAYAVVKTQGDSFGILAPVDPLPLQPGDMFVGALRPGHISLRFLRFPEQELGPAVLVDVRAAGVPLAEAQQQWRELCAGRDA